MLGQICLWCTVIHVVTAVLFIYYLTVSLAGSPELD